MSVVSTSATVVGAVITATAAAATAVSVAEGGIKIDALTGIGLVVSLAGTIAFLFKMFIASKDAQITDKDALIAAKDAEHAAMIKERDAQNLALQGAQKSYQEISAEALRSALETANYYRQRAGQPPLVPLAPTVPESHSPSTHEQRMTADIATKRAMMAMIRKETGQEVRPTPERAPETHIEASTPVQPIELPPVKVEIMNEEPVNVKVKE